MISFKQIRDGIQQTVYRIIDMPVRGMVRIGLTPNMMTTVGLLGNLVASFLIVWAALISQQSSINFRLIGWSGVLVLFFSIFDMVDGYMARTANMETRFGAFYDSVLDRYCELSTLSALAFFFVQTGYIWFALCCFLSLVGSVMVSYVRARAEGLGYECKVGFMQRPERVVVTSIGLAFGGFLSECVSFDSMWIVALPQMLIAVLANWTAVVRILHVKRQMEDNVRA
ncbi:MAG: CDP-alcohol phosphatidyltransferase family protein [Bacteroidaceae bacterium]|nr:CDP-alcohol phosphatidyltransferase family protein [Bacteroidaceae bacterium]